MVRLKKKRKLKPKNQIMEICFRCLLNLTPKTPKFQILNLQHRIVVGNDEESLASDSKTL